MVEALEVQGANDEKQHHHKSNWQFLVTLAFFEIIVVVFLGVVCDYADATTSTGAGSVTQYYAMFQDVHVMIFIGFGFLMTFLRKHAFSSIGMTFLIGVLCIQLSIVFNTVFEWAFANSQTDLIMTIETLIKGDFAAGAVLISYGAVLGRASHVQILWMIFFELIFYALNEQIGVHELKAVDMGGSIFVHSFGAFFGLAFSWALGPPSEAETEDESSVYHSDLFAMIGTVFLWMFWPSFNGALCGEAFHAKERVVINTVLALCSSCTFAFFFSHLYTGKLDMVHIQNASLAGGVAIGSSSDLVVGPVIAIVIGFLAGAISTTGYVYLTPVLNKCGIYDVCGINNLHGMPGLLGGIAGAISAASADKSYYGNNIGQIFPGRGAPDNWSASKQGTNQFLAVVITLTVSIFGGIATGLIVGYVFDQKKQKFIDEEEWEVPTQEFGASYFPLECNRK